jgi:hypothetical protein
MNNPFEFALKPLAFVAALPDRQVRGQLRPVGERELTAERSAE